MKKPLKNRSRKNVGTANKAKIQILAKVKPEAQENPMVKVSDILPKEKSEIKHQEKCFSDLFNLITEQEALCLVDLNGRPFLYFPAENMFLEAGGKDTIRYLKSCLFTKYGKSLSNSGTFTEFCSLLEALIINNLKADKNPGMQIFKRCGHKDGKVYLDSRHSNQVIEIDGDGYRIVENSPVFFMRDVSRHQSPLPQGVDKNHIYKLREYVNCKGDNFKLLVCYLIHCFFPEEFPGGAKVILVLEGQAGSAKTTLAKIIKRIVDPSDLDTPSSMQKDKKDIFTHAEGNWLISYDNISDITDQMSDILCTISTGSLFEVRKLYTDKEISRYQAKRPVVINGISDFITREDLLSRCIILNLPILEKSEAESILFRGFDEELPQILGAILTIVSDVLRELPDVQVPKDKDFRMMDFARIGIAVEKSLGWDDGEFCEIYERNLKSSSITNIYQDPVGLALILYLKDKTKDMDDETCFIRHTPEQWLNILNEKCQSDKLPPLPYKNCASFSKKIWRLNSSLKKIGITAEKYKSNQRSILMNVKKEKFDKNINLEADLS